MPQNHTSPSVANNNASCTTLPSGPRQQKWRQQKRRQQPRTASLHTGVDTVITGVGPKAQTPSPHTGADTVITGVDTKAQTQSLPTRMDTTMAGVEMKLSPLHTGVLTTIRTKTTLASHIGVICV